MDSELEKIPDVEAVPQSAEPQEEDLDALLQRINENREEEGVSQQHFKIKSDIGKDDYRAFLYYSVLLKSRWFLPACIIIPIASAISFAWQGGRINVTLGLIILIVFYILIAGVIIFRTERSLSKNNKKNPDLMMLTPTTFTFLSNVIINEKKGAQVRVPYKSLSKVRETQKRVILYFVEKKAMIIRKEDIVRDASSLQDFLSFIRSKLN
ncbi:MAG: YcxB family protein [Oscillospiraceae bacterium]